LKKIFGIKILFLMRKYIMLIMLDVVPDRETERKELVER